MRASKEIWKTKDGRIIPFSELEDDHLLNILAMLKDNDELRRYRVAGSLLMLSSRASEESGVEHICTGLLNELADAEWFEWGKAKEMMDLAISRSLDVSALKEKISIDEATYRLVKNYGVRAE